MTLVEKHHQTPQQCPSPLSTPTAQDATVQWALEAVSVSSRLPPLTHQETKGRPFKATSQASKRTLRDSLTDLMTEEPASAHNTGHQAPPQSDLQSPHQIEDCRAGWPHTDPNPCCHPERTLQQLPINVSLEQNQHTHKTKL